MNSQDTFTDIILNGGGTYELTDDGFRRIEWEQGYVVGIVRGSAVRIQTWLHGTALPIDAIDSAMRWVKVHHHDCQFVGVWYDAGAFHIDPVVHVYDARLAHQMGTFFGQQAVWSCADKEAVNL